MKRKLSLLAALLSLSALFSSTADAVVLYRQVFGLAEGSSNKLLTDVGWAAYYGRNSELQVGSSYYCLRSYPSAPGTTDLENVNSSVTAASLTHGVGRFYYFPSGSGPNPGNIYIPNATEQAAFGTIDYDNYQSLTLSVYSQDPSLTFRFIVEITTGGGTTAWVATDSYTNTNEWQKHILNYTEDPSQWYSLTFVKESGVPITISSDTLAGQSIAFPDGEITNFGILVDEGGKTGIDFDAFEVTGVIPEPAAYSAVFGGVLLMVLCVRRRRS